MDPILEGLITAVVGFLTASGGFWLYLTKRSMAKNANTRLIMGLAYDKIVHYGMMYIGRGWVTKDEYEDLVNYFYKPYLELGGNGTAERIMRVVERLPFVDERSPLAAIAETTSIRATDPTAPKENTHE